MSIRNRSSLKNYIQGFTLVEVLVALLVLAFGLLGLASLQLYGLRQNQTALYRSLATQMAYEITDRIRANPSGFEDGKYNRQAETTDDCLAGTCTPTKMAGFDLKQWNDSVKTLPRGVGVVCKDSGPIEGDGTGEVVAGALTDAGHGCDNSGNVYVVKLWWDERRASNENAPALTQFVMSFQL